MQRHAGPHRSRWVATTAVDGTRRLDDAGDWVRLEVETALRRPEVAVVPVLVNGATMPAGEELRALAARQAFVLRAAKTPQPRWTVLVTTMQQTRVGTSTPGHHPAPHPETAGKLE